MSIKDLVVTSRRFFNAFITRANKGESSIRAWQIGPAVVAFPEDGPIAFCTTALSYRLEDRPLRFQVTGEPIGSSSVATWEPLERTEDDDKHQKAANRALSLLNAESPVTVNVNPKLLTEALALMEEEECILDLIPSIKPDKAEPWIAVRLRDSQSIAMVAAIAREGLVNTTGTWCDRYPRPNAAKPEIDLSGTGWYRLSGKDAPEHDQACLVAVRDKNGAWCFRLGRWSDEIEDWFDDDTHEPMFGSFSPLHSLAPVYWTNGVDPEASGESQVRLLEHFRMGANSDKPKIEPPDDWFCISDGDYPDDGDDCTVAFVDAHGEIRIHSGAWLDTDWIYYEGDGTQKSLFGAIPVDALPFPVYWVPKRLSESEAIEALTGYSESEPTDDEPIDYDTEPF